jgi:hypothetical protein
MLAGTTPGARRAPPVRPAPPAAVYVGKSYTVLGSYLGITKLFSRRQFPLVRCLVASGVVS